MPRTRSQKSGNESSVLSHLSSNKPNPPPLSSPSSSSSDVHDTKTSDPGDTTSTTKSSITLSNPALSRADRAKRKGFSVQVLPFGSISESVKRKRRIPQKKRVQWCHILQPLHLATRLRVNADPVFLSSEERSSVHALATLLVSICTRPHPELASVLVLTGSRRDARNIEVLIEEMLDASPQPHRETPHGKSIGPAKIVTSQIMRDFAEEGRLNPSSRPVMDYLMRTMSGNHPLVCIGQVDDILACLKITSIIKLCDWVIAFEMPSFKADSKKCERLAHSQNEPVFLRVETVGSRTKLGLFRWQLGGKLGA